MQVWLFYERTGIHRRRFVPPICHELWNSIYPSVYTLLNGGTLDYGEGKAKMFDAKCQDEGRVLIHGEVIDE